ncbi:MAG: ATP-binding protein [Acholeplasmataceae bacterium]
MKRIVFISGYYGSGKTEVSLNLAKQFHFNYLVDLDIINPYFRSREARDILDDVEIISSDLQNDTYTDLPYLSKKIFLPLQNPNAKALYDLGGNDLGAKVMRQFEDLDMNEVDFFLVVNIFRPETNSLENILKMINKIEGSSGYKITGLIHNSNLLKETTIEDILEGQKIIHQVYKMTGIEVVFTTLHENLYNKDVRLLGNILKLKTYLTKNWY